MTSPASLRKTKNNFPYAFRTSFSAGAIFAAAEAGMMMFAYMFLTFFNYREMNKNFAEAFKTSGVREKISDTITFILCPSPDIVVPMTVFGTIFISIVLGVKMFRFITNKKTVNVYYSLGIKRVTLFAARYLSGLAMLVAAIFVAFLASAAINIAFVGSSAQLWQAVFFNATAFSVLAAVCYSATAAVFSCVGTMYEGGIFTAVLLAIPSIFFYGLETLSKNFLYGSPYGKSFVDATGNYMRSGSLTTEFSFLNPYLFINNLVTDFQTASPGQNGAVLNSYDLPWEAPSYGLLLLWALVAAALFGIGILTFQHRKAEICGFVGMSRPLNAAITFILGFFGFTLCMNTVMFTGKVGAILIGIAVFTVIYFVSEMIFLRSFKQFFKSLWKLPIHLAVSVIIAVIFVSGGFGYSAKTPALEDIESVSINTLTTDSRTAAQNDYYGGYSFNTDVGIPIRTFSSALTGEFTSESDVSRIIDLQKDYISFSDKDNSDADTVYVPMFFVYKLKNGSTFTRHYAVADMKTVIKTASMCDSDLKDSLITDCYTKEHEASDYDTAKSTYDFNLSAFVYGTGKVYAVSPMLDTSTEMELTAEQHKALKECIAKDLLNQDAAAILTPSKPATGAIWFNASVEDEEANYSVSINGGKPNEFIARADPTSLVGGSYVYLTPDMVNTLAFLTENGFMSLFEDTAEIVEVTFAKGTYKLENWYFEASFDPTPEMIASPNLANFFMNDEMMGKSSVGENKITDAKKIDELKGLTHLKYYSDGSGYQCFFKFANGDIVSKYLSESDAPDYVKSYSYNQQPKAE